jgi:Zn-dependent protease with chaperone function
MLRQHYRLPGPSARAHHVARRLGVVCLALLVHLPAICQAQQLQLYAVATIAANDSKESVRRYFGDLNSVFFRLQRAAGTNATLYYSPASVVNAFATVSNGRNIVVVYGGLLSLLGDDRDAIAAVLGHELGHVKFHHVTQGQQVNNALKLITGLAGLAVDVHEAKHGKPQLVGVGAAGADLGFVLASRAYTRDQEREADHESVELLVASGIDPEAAVRVQQKLLAVSGSKQFPIFATHPSSQERIDNLHTQIASVAPQLEESRRAAAQAEAGRAQSEQARQAAAAAKDRENATARAAFHEQASQTLSNRKQAVRTEEALVLERADSRKNLSAPVATPGGSNVKEQCSDVSPIRRNCITTGADGRTVVQRCDKQEERWECRPI